MPSLCLRPIRLRLVPSAQTEPYPAQPKRKKGRWLVSSRLHKDLSLVLVGLLIATSSEAMAQRHGGKSHGGGWHGGGWRGGGGHIYGARRGYAGNVAYYGRRGYSGYPAYSGYGGVARYPAYYRYGGYGGYPGYYGYGGYYGHGGYYGYHHNDGAWIALGAGVVGIIVGSILARPRVYQYYNPYEAPPPPPAPQPQQAPATPLCQDGTPVPVGGYCTAPPAEPVLPPKPARG